MTKDLLAQKEKVEESQRRLQSINREIEEKNRYMEVLLQNITAGVISVDPSGIVTSFNSAAERLLKTKAQTVIGKPIAEGLAGVVYEQLWKPLSQKLSLRSGYSAQVELPIDGEDITLLVDSTRIYDQDRLDRGTILVFDDATEQVKAQRVAAWREVARRIAHEIKNPLTPIKLNAERLLRRFKDHFSAQDLVVFQTCIESILQQVDSLRDLVNEFSKFSRIPGVRVQKQSLNEIIQDAVSFYQMSYPDVRFDMSGLKPTPDVPIDKDQMNRVFVNLFTNAIAAMQDLDSPWEISIRSDISRDTNVVRVEVADTGCGIPVELRNRVLEPYFSTKANGTGLGLAIVNQIISDHGGYLRIGTNAPRGTKIVLELPLA